MNSKKEIKGSGIFPLIGNCNGECFLPERGERCAGGERIMADSIIRTIEEQRIANSVSFGGGLMHARKKMGKKGDVDN